MLHLAFIFHMHQPYYKSLLTGESDFPWVRLHGTKDYLDMAEILEKYPLIHQTFNLVPSLMEQIEDYAEYRVKDRFLELSYKAASKLTETEKKFILDNFFMINKDKAIAMHPRYYELYLKKTIGGIFSQQDYLDLQVWFNLCWIDPSFRRSPALKDIVEKARFFTEEEKNTVLNQQLGILRNILPTYKKLATSRQIEVTVSPYYHPILPLLFNTNCALEANPKSILPQLSFVYPQDVETQIQEAVNFYRERFGKPPLGMWPSEQGVSEHVLPFIMRSGINWIITDEAILFKTIKRRTRKSQLLYRPYLLKRKDGELNILFRDRNLSDLIGFTYQSLKATEAVGDFMQHLRNISDAFKGQDVLVTVALDGENAWEYYQNDGYDFLSLLYERLSESEFLKTVTVSEYLKTHPAGPMLKRLSAGSWIYAQFAKWIGSPGKNKAWEYLTTARAELERLLSTEPAALNQEALKLAWKQIHILEGSDWFWWYDENQPDFDRLFRMHLSNFYSIIGKEVPAYLKIPI